MKEQEILETIKRENVQFVKLMFTDVSGVLRCVEISVNSLTRAFDNKIMVDGSNIRGFSTVNAADTLLAPDLSTFKLLPFFESQYGSVAIMICDVLTPDGKVAPGCTRSNLKRELGKLNALGFSKMNVGFEPEFFIFKDKSIAKSGLLDNGIYCADENNDEGAAIRREIMYELGRIGIEAATSHHECAPGQYELTYKFTDALAACDNILLFKFLVKAIVKKHGYAVTFMPKPIMGIAGNGLHTNVSLMTKDDNNAFWDVEKQAISGTAKEFIKGVLLHARGISILTNPTINSYKRLVSGYEAPVTICWSVANRSSMIRVPMATGSAARIEIRNTDSSANPYLAIAGILSAGLDGIKSKTPLIPSLDHNVFKLTSQEKRKLRLRDLPASLSEAITEFKADKVIKRCVTKKIADEIIACKQTEIRNYNTIVNNFDLEHYFDV